MSPFRCRLRIGRARRASRRETREMLTDPAFFLLRPSSLTTLVTIATANAAALLPILMSGNRTVFAPTNEASPFFIKLAPVLTPLSRQAFAALPAEVSGNATLVAQVVLYHILTGSFPAASLNSTPTIARSVLNSSLVALPRGQPQALVLTGNGTMVTVNQALTNVTSLATAMYRNLIVHVVPTVLTYVYRSFPRVPHPPADFEQTEKIGFPFFLLKFKLLADPY